MKKSSRTPLVVLLALSLMLTLLSGCTSREEKNAAIAECTSEYDRIMEEQEALEDAISQCEELVEAAEPAYDPETLTALETATTDARSSIVEDVAVPEGKIEEIQAATKEMAEISYEDALEDLNKAKEEYETSVKIMQQITNPSEEFVISRLKDIEGITNYAAVTEENDPNELLHKAGGYNAAIVFEYDKVDPSEPYGDTLVEKGVDAGGTIEVFETAEEAEKRENYISAFDGSALRPGSHKVLGSIVIRISDYLTATQQKELEELLIEVFTAL